MSISGERNYLLLNPSPEAHFCVRKEMSRNAMAFVLFEKYLHSQD